MDLAMSASETDVRPPSRRELIGRMDRLPASGLGALGFAALLICYLFANYDIGVIALALPAMIADLHLDTAEISLPITANLLAYVIGAYVFGTVADRVGRRPGLLFTVLTLAVGALLTAFSWNAASLAAFRFITGLGMGAMLSLGATYISELMPATQRGQFLSRIYLIQTVLLAAVGFASLPILQLGPIGWRLLFGFAALVIVAVLAFTDRRLPESPRWLVDHAQLDRARRIVAELEARAYKRVGGAPPTYEEVIDGLGRSSPEDSEDVAFPTLALLRPPYVSRMLMVLGFWFLFYFPVYAYLSYTPLIFKALGETETNALLETVLGRVAPLLVFAFLFFFVERIQRRLLIFAGVGLIALGLLLIIAGLGTLGALIGSVVITAGISPAVAPAYIYTAEVFPTRARASATAIGDGIGHLGGAVQPFLFLPVLNSFGPVAAVIMLVVVLGVSGACILAGVNTRSKTLTELAAA